MKVNKLKISNILGLDELEIKPGNIVTISGQNGAGKTSVLEAIKAALQGGNDATLLRKGAKEGEIVLELDSGMTIKKTVKDKSTTTVTDSTGQKVKQPQSELDRLRDLLSVNPIKFLTSAPDDRARVLLETLKIEVDDEELGIDGYSKEVLKESGINYNVIKDGLERLDKEYQTLYNERTVINRGIRDNSQTVEQLNKSIEQFDVIPGVIETQINELEIKQKERLDGKDKWNLELLDKRDKQLSEIEEERARILAELDAKKQSVLTEYQTQKDAMYSAFEVKFNKGEQELSVLRSKMQQIGAVNNTLEIISNTEQELENLNEKATNLNANMDKIKALKLSKLNNLPIKGLEVIEKNIFVDGIPFDRLNTAKQISIAVEVSKLRAGDLGIVCLDGIERFDDNTFAEFKRQMTESNLQAFVTKVDNSPELSVLNED